VDTGGIDMKLVEEKRLINDIPVLICKREDAAQKPLVILSHGFNGSKESFKDKGYLQNLAEKGYYVVALDNRLHGERPGPGLSPTIIGLSGNINLLNLRKTIKETADDIPVLIDELLKEPEVDKGRIAMIGVSMGGFITFKTIAIEPRITVGIPIISSPYWDDIPDGKAFATDPKTKTEVKLYAEAYHPVLDIAKFFPRAILMQIGKADQHFDVSKVIGFYQQLKEHYQKSPGNIRLIIYPDTQHEFTEEMWDESIRWLQAKL
jgi:dienelactone hydrolase